MNAGGVLNTCKSNGPSLVGSSVKAGKAEMLELLEVSGKLKSVSGRRVSNTWVTCPKVGNNCPKGQLIPHVIHRYGGG